MNTTILLPRHTKKGLNIEEVGDDFVLLKIKDKVVQGFTQMVSRDTIIEEADEFLKRTDQYEE